MELRQKEDDGTEIITEVRICVLCTKPINTSKDKFVHSRKKGRDYYAHEKCVLKGFKS